MRTSVKLGALVVVTQQELDNILAGKQDLLIRDLFPEQFKHSVNGFPLYFVLKGTSFVKGTALCTFIMHTIGTEQECNRAGITEEKFEEKYAKTYTFGDSSYVHADAYAWSLRNVHSLDLQISEFTATNLRKKSYYKITRMARSFVYVLAK